MVFIQPPQPFLSSKGYVQTVANQGRERMQKQKRSSQETMVQPCQGPGACSMNIQYLWVLLHNWDLIQVENGNFWLSTRFLECTLFYHQQIRRKSHTLQPSSKFLPIKPSPPKPSNSFGVLSMSHLFSLLGPAINPSLLQTTDVLVCLASWWLQ